MKRHIFYALSAIAVLSLCLGFYSHSRVNTYVTWDSLEPDKWASVWLIKSHLDPQAYFDIRPNGDSLVGGITFGVLDGQFQRSSTKSTFATLLQTSNHHDPTLLKLAQIITEIETMSWAIDQNSKTAVR